MSLDTHILLWLILSITISTSYDVVQLEKHVSKYDFFVDNT